MSIAEAHNNTENDGERSVKERLLCVAAAIVDIFSETESQQTSVSLNVGTFSGVLPPYDLRVQVCSKQIGTEGNQIQSAQFWADDRDVSTQIKVEKTTREGVFEDPFCIWFADTFEAYLQDQQQKEQEEQEVL